MSADGAYGKLLVFKPDKSREEVFLTKPEFRIGGDATCDLALVGPNVARVHAVLRAASGWVTILAMPATPPVLVNEVPVTQQILNQGDVIVIGGNRLVYHTVSAAPAAVPAAPAWSAAAPPAAPSQAWPAVAPPAQPAWGPAPAPPSRSPSSMGLESDSGSIRVPAQALHSPTGATPGLQPSTDVSLVVYAPSGTYSYSLEAGRQITIGSDAHNDVHVNFATRVKPTHARIEWEGPNALIVDAEGKTDVLINGQQASRRALVNGDFLKLGDARFVYHDTRSLAGGGLAAPVGTMTGALNRSTLTKTMRLGRDPANEISLNSLQVSRFHAEIQKRDRDFYVVDLGSTNGTFHNGQRLQPEGQLKKGDVIRISDFNFLFDGEKLEHYSEEGNARIDAIRLKRVVGHNKTILHDISLSIYPREFVALVGVSGAGKSTLMNALSGFRPADEGTVLLNGTDYYHHFDAFRTSLGYVPQDDIIHKELTVYRALHYAACLRMPEDVSPAEIHHRLEEVMKDLHLTEHRDTAISRLSGGQRKRVSIGVELLTKPRLFYLDEPTSGLDPGMETEMMRIFRNLADKGHTLILITHATKNITLCDKVIFLAEGGHLAFFGSPAEALKYFGTTDFTDIYLKLENEKSPDIWDAEYKASPYYQRNVVDRLKDVNALVAKAQQREKEEKEDRSKREAGKPRQSMVRQFALLTARYFEIMLRDPVNLSIMLGSAVVVALLFLAFGSNVLDHFDLSRYNLAPFATGSADIKEVASHAFNARLVTFLATIAAVFFGVNNAFLQIAKEIPIYKRERTVNLGIFSYVMSKVVVLSLVCFIQVCILELMLGYRFTIPDASNELYAKIFLVLFATSLAAMAMGLMFSALASNEKQAGSVLPILIMPQIFLTGSLPKLEGTAKIVTYFGLSKWPFEVLGNLFRIWKIYPADEDLANPQLKQVLHDLVAQGQDYQTQLADVHYWTYMAILGVFFAAFIAMTCAFQLRKDQVKE